ncbi:MAG: hypothetical protein NTW29_16575 [Bacteroidetes bacterium]|nr:hypothetical protein [Bacteroidota bacterium]
MTQFEGQQKELSKLIHNWILLHATSASEFNDISKKLLHSLYEGASFLKIMRIIESELVVTFGLYKTEFDAELLANQVMYWWER